MKKLPNSQYPAILRTDFTNERVWRNIKKSALGDDLDEGDDFAPYFIDDPAFDGLTKEQLLEGVPKDYANSFIFVVDGTTVAEKHHPVLVEKLKRQPGLEFRAVPSAIETVLANLFLANCDFEDFVRSASKSGVYRAP